MQGPTMSKNPRLPNEPEPKFDLADPLANPPPVDRAPVEEAMPRLPNESPLVEVVGQPTPNASGVPLHHPLGPVEPLP